VTTDELHTKRMRKQQHSLGGKPTQYHGCRGRTFLTRIGRLPLWRLTLSLALSAPPSLHGCVTLETQPHQPCHWWPLPSNVANIWGRQMSRDAWSMPLVAPSVYEAYDKGLAEGQSFEREAIVAWMRSQHVTRRGLKDRLADRIERGEHLRGDDE